MVRWIRGTFDPLPIPHTFEIRETQLLGYAETPGCLCPISRILYIDLILLAPTLFSPTSYTRRKILQDGHVQE